MNCRIVKIIEYRQWLNSVVMGEFLIFASVMLAILPPVNTSQVFVCPN